MRIRNAAELRQALDDAVERGLQQARESFQAAGLDDEDLDALLASERRRLMAWRDQVEATIMHEAAAPPLPAGATVSVTPKPTGRLH